MWVPVPVVLLVPTSALPLPTGPAMGGPPPLIRSSIDSRRVVISWQFSRRAHRLVWKRENRPLLKTTWLDKPWFKNTSKVLKYRVFWFPDFRIIQFCFKKTYWNTDLCCQIQAGQRQFTTPCLWQQSHFIDLHTLSHWDPLSNWCPWLKPANFRRNPVLFVVSSLKPYESRLWSWSQISSGWWF